MVAAVTGRGRGLLRLEVEEPARPEPLPDSETAAEREIAASGGDTEQQGTFKAVIKKRRLKKKGSPAAAGPVGRE